MNWNCYACATLRLSDNELPNTSATSREFPYPYMVEESFPQVSSNIDQSAVDMQDYFAATPPQFNGASTSTPNTSSTNQNFRNVINSSTDNSFNFYGFASSNISNINCLLDEEFSSVSGLSVPDLSFQTEPTVSSLDDISLQEKESLIQDDPLPVNLSLNFDPHLLTFEIVDNATSKGKRLLIDSTGYSYTFVSESKKSIKWRCSKRNKKIYCNARVTQVAGIFRLKNAHVHPSNLSELITAKFLVTCKERALSHPFLSASAIVEEMMVKFFGSPSCIQKPNPELTARNINNYRQKNRPKEPKNLQFTIENLQFPPDFLKGDVIVGGKRHLIFATENMLAILSNSKNWYIDSTYKVMRKPFRQLFSIHAYIPSSTDDAAKQIPLLFAAMSGQRAKDYVAVMQAILNVPEMRNKKVSSITIDYEAAMWVAFTLTLPRVKLYGCHFHWCQAVYRRIQQLGMAESYMRNNKTTKFCLKLMALPFLAPKHIASIFSTIKGKTVNSAECFKKLIAYVECTWFNNSLWTPDSWSVFNRAIRTTNDVEGWHNRLNNRVNHKSVGVQELAQMLYEEWSYSELVVELVTDDELKRRQKTRIKDKINNPPKNPNEQEICKVSKSFQSNSVEDKLIRTRRRKLKSKSSLVDTSRYVSTNIGEYPKSGREFKPIPTLTQMPNEVDYKFFRRVHKATEVVKHEAQFQDKYKVEVKRDETGQVTGYNKRREYQSKKKLEEAVARKEKKKLKNKVA